MHGETNIQELASIQEAFEQAISLPHCAGCVRVFVSSLDTGVVKSSIVTELETRKKNLQLGDSEREMYVFVIIARKLHASRSQ